MKYLWLLPPDDAPIRRSEFISKFTEDFILILIFYGPAHGVGGRRRRRTSRKLFLQRRTRPGNSVRDLSRKTFERFSHFVGSWATFKSGITFACLRLSPASSTLQNEEKKRKHEMERFSGANFRRFNFHFWKLWQSRTSASEIKLLFFITQIVHR